MWIFDRIKSAASKEELEPIVPKTTNVESKSKKSCHRRQQQPVSKCVYLLTFCAALSSCNLGFDIGVNTDAAKLVQKSMQLSDVQLETFVGSINLYAIVGALISSSFVSEYGFRMSFLGSAILFVGGILIQVLSSTFGMLMFGRVFVGVGVGFGMTIGPMYISEIAPKHARGALVSWSEIGINVGILLGFASGLIFYDTPPNIGWRSMFVLGGILPIALILLSLFYIRESPRWLLLKDRDEDALNVLKELNPDEDNVEHYLREVHADIQEEVEAEAGHSVWAELLCSSRPAIRRMVMLGIGIGVSVQASGIDAIQYYLVYIFEEAGMRDRWSQALFLTGLGCLKLSMIFVASLLVDNLGRRPLLFISLSGMIVALLIIASEFAGETGITTVLIGLALYLAFFSLGLGPLNWVITNEIFPLTLRPAGVSLSIFCNRIAATIASSTMLSMTNLLGFGGFFLFLVFVCAAILIFFYIYLPETKGISLEEIAHYFNEICSGPQSEIQHLEDTESTESPRRYDSSKVEMMSP